MTVTKDILAQLTFFADLELKTLNAIAKAGQIQSLNGGSVLFEQGSQAEAVYFVISGRLVAARHHGDPDNENSNDTDETIIGYISAGEPVGEMSLLLDEIRSASVFALRDTSVLRIEHETFDDLLEAHGDLAATLSRAMLRRSRQPAIAHKNSAPQVFALISTSPSIDVDNFADDLTKSIRKLGTKAASCSHRSEIFTAEEFTQLESDHDIIILSASVGDTPWYRFVLRHADRFFVLARRDSVPPKPFPLVTDDASPARRFRLVDLILIPEGVPACPITQWRDAINAQRIFIWKGEATCCRLARVITGKSVGIIMSGGGARAYAHIGAVRALREAGIPIDFACGTSMGGIIAACVALEWSDEEVDYRIRQAFVDSNPLSDFRLPVVALTHGEIVEDRLRSHFGDTLIEEMDLPFFCVSAELTEGRSYIHRTGLLRDALRASISLPGILPPVVVDNKLLVDGGLINNFPTNIMAQTHRGVNIGIDVARKGSIDPNDYVDSPSFIKWVRQYGIKSPPPIVGLLMRAATTRRESTMLHHPADILITPPVQGVDLRAWAKYDLAVHEGYKATIRALEENPGSLAMITSCHTDPASPPSSSLSGTPTQNTTITR